MSNERVMRPEDAVPLTEAGLPSRLADRGLADPAFHQRSFARDSVRWKPQVIWDPEWVDRICWEGPDSTSWNHLNMYGRALLIDEERIVHGTFRSAIGKSYLFKWDVERASGTLRPDPSPVAASDDDAQAFSVRHHEDGSVGVIDHGLITFLPSLGRRKSEARM